MKVNENETARELAYDTRNVTKPSPWSNEKTKKSTSKIRELFSLFKGQINPNFDNSALAV